MKTQLFFYLSVFLLATACGKSKGPGLSDKELFAQKETPDTKQKSKKETVSPDTGTYVVPAGIKYTESRAVDPANPPVVFDIANRKLNIKKFNLSDYYTKVRFIKIKHPMPANEGNFLFDADYYISFENGAISGFGLSSRFNFMKDSIIAGDVYFGYYSYDYEGKFLHTIKTYDFPKVYNASKNTISYNREDYKRAIEQDGTHRNNTLFNADDKTSAKYVYNTEDTLSRDFLFTFS